MDISCRPVLPEAVQRHKGVECVVREPLPVTLGKRTVAGSIVVAVAGRFDLTTFDVVRATTDEGIDDGTKEVTNRNRG